MVSVPTSTGTSTAKRRRFSRIVGIVAIPIFLAIGAVGVYLIVSAFSSPAQDRVTQAGLTYGQQEMEWISGPTVLSTHRLRLRNLAPVLVASVPAHVAVDVNVPDLIRRFGANRQVGLIVLSGVFNSLPPDEGVVEHSQVIVLVDVKQDRGLYLND